jgi:DNA polymerase III delta prime subunit
MTHLFIGPDNDLVSTAIGEFILAKYPEFTSGKVPVIAEIEHPDLHLLNGYEEDSLGIERMKIFTKTLHKKPFKAAVQLGVIVGFENTTPEAQNASLKELEDHTSNVIYLLGSIEESAILPTIKSRATLHYVTGVSLQKQHKEIIDLVTLLTTKPFDAIDFYNKVSAKEWTRSSAESFLKEFYAQKNTQITKETLTVLQKCSDYLQNNVSPKHVILYLSLSL